MTRCWCVVIRVPTSASFQVIINRYRWRMSTTNAAREITPHINFFITPAKCVKRWWLCSPGQLWPVPRAVGVVFSQKQGIQVTSQRFEKNKNHWLGQTSSYCRGVLKPNRSSYCITNTCRFSEIIVSALCRHSLIRNIKYQYLSCQRLMWRSSFLHKLSTQYYGC